MLRTSSYDLSPSPSRSAPSRAGTGKDCYYYYVYRKKIDPTEIRTLEDLPVPSLFRQRSALSSGNLTGSLPKLTDIEIRKSAKGSTDVSGLRTSSGPERRKRSSSLPELKKAKGSPTSKGSPSKRKRNSRNRLKPITTKRATGKQGGARGKDKSQPLPKISQNGSVLSPPSTTGSMNSGYNMTKYPMAATLLKLTPEDGLQWAKHTTISKGPNGVTEKTIDVQTRKVFSGGKWIEELTKTETITDERGSTTKSKKTTFRDLLSNELPQTPFSDKLISSPEELTTPPHVTTLPALKKTQQTQNKNLAPRDNQKSFARQVLVATNSYRKIHGAPPLLLSDKLSTLAKDWAERLAKMEKMEHGDRKNIGENIYCKTSSQPWFEMKGDEVVENWYSEVEDHKYNEEPNQGYLKTGHFTQLVWRDTTEMGVAFARNKNGHMAFVVAYFSPKGNWIGEFKQQVLPPGGVQKPKKMGPTTKSVTRNNTRNKSNLIDDSSNQTVSKRGDLTSPPQTVTKNNRSGTSTGSSEIITRNSLDSPKDNYSISEEGSPKNNYYSKIPTDSPKSYQSKITPGSPGKFESALSQERIRNTASSTRSRTSSGKLDSPITFTVDRHIETGENRISRNKITSPGTLTRNTFSTSSRVTSPAPSLKSMAEENFMEDFLNAHNYYRERHGVQSLKLNAKLSKFAQEWSDRIAKVDRMEHRDENEYGENIYMKWSPDPKYRMPGEEAVDSWYEEIKEYDFGKEPIDLSAGHFTQVVWAESEELGVGITKSSSNKIYVVANYDPPGNYIGQFSKMVPPPL